jgi:hypothetical protein
MFYRCHIIGIHVISVHVSDIQAADDHMVGKPDALVFQQAPGTGMVTSVNDHNLFGILCRLNKTADPGGDTGQAENTADPFICQLPGGPIGQATFTSAA